MAPSVAFDSEGAAVTVFSFSKNANGLYVATAMSLLVAFLIVSHKSLSILDKGVSKKAFHDAIQSLNKELLIMGLASFILTLLSSGGLKFENVRIYLVRKRQQYHYLFSRIYLTVTFFYSKSPMCLCS
jgi:hypothetical protein